MIVLPLEVLFFAPARLIWRFSEMARTPNSRGNKLLYIISAQPYFSVTCVVEDVYEIENDGNNERFTSCVKGNLYTVGWSAFRLSVWFFWEIEAVTKLSSDLLFSLDALFVLLRHLIRLIETVLRVLMHLSVAHAVGYLFFVKT